MEKNFNIQVEDLMNEGNVKGVICTDSNGLPYAVKGVAQETHAGVISSIAQHASKLYPDDVPVISIETEDSNLLIRRHDQVVLGIYKSKT